MRSKKVVITIETFRAFPTETLKDLYRSSCAVLKSEYSTERQKHEHTRVNRWVLEILRNERGQR